MIQTFSVVRDFNAMTAISGRLREFKSGELIAVDSAQAGDVVAIESESRIFLVDRRVFEISCKRNNDGAAPFF